MKTFWIFLFLVGTPFALFAREDKYVLTLKTKSVYPAVVYVLRDSLNQIYHIDVANIYPKSESAKPDTFRFLTVGVRAQEYRGIESGKKVEFISSMPWGVKTDPDSSNFQVYPGFKVAVTKDSVLVRIPGGGTIRYKSVGN